MSSRNKGEQSENLHIAEEERTLSFHLLTHCPHLSVSVPLGPFLLYVIGVNYQSDQGSGHSILLHTLSHTTVSFWNWQPVCACILFTNLQQRAFLDTAQERKNHTTIAQSDLFMRME